MAERRVILFKAIAGVLAIGLVTWGLYQAYPPIAPMFVGAVLLRVAWRLEKNRNARSPD